MINHYLFNSTNIRLISLLLFLQKIKTKNHCNINIRDMDFIIEFLNITTQDQNNMDNLTTQMNCAMQNGSPSSGLQENSIELWIVLIFLCLVHMILNYIYYIYKF